MFFPLYFNTSGSGCGTDCYTSFFFSLIKFQQATMADQNALLGTGLVTTDSGIIIIEDDEVPEVIETGVEARSPVEIIDINDNDSLEVIEIDDDEADLLELTQYGVLHEHRGQHITTGTSCDKCAKLLDVDPDTEEHLGNHQHCRKCDDII